MKKILLLAVASILLVACDKEDNQESDFIVKEYGDDYVLDFYDHRGISLTGNSMELGVNIDINDDGEDDVMICLLQGSAIEDLHCIPLSSNVTMGGLYPFYLQYGDIICDTTRWERERSFFDVPRPNADKYLAVKFETDTSVNYGWFLLLAEPHYLYDLDNHCTVSIVKSAYCKTNGKAIFVGQEE